MSGENHPDTLSIKHNMVGIFLSPEKYDGALRMFQEICNIEEATLGENHSQTLNTKNSIAGMLANHSKYDEALQIFQEICDVQKAILRKNHCNILHTKNNIAGILFTQGKYSDALQIYQEVLNTDKAILGENHPDVLCTHRRVAEVLRRQGKYDKALEVCQEVFDKQIDTLGSDHPDTLNTRYSKALILDDQGNYSDALQIYQKVLSKRKVILGNNHPDTLKIINCIAVIFSKQGEYDKALYYYQKILTVQDSSLGENHPDILATTNNFGMVLYSKKNYDIALEIFQEVFNELQKLLPDHPDTLSVKNNIALALSSQKKHDEALKMFREVLDSQEANIGKGHYNITTTKNNIASILLTQGKHNEALKVLQEVFTGLGPEHPETLRISNTIQSLLMSANDLLNAVKNNNLKQIENLVEKGGDVNTKDNDERTLLHYAVDNGNTNIVNILLKNGADVTQITNKGNTPLHIATSRGHKEIVEVLLQHISHDKLNNFINAQTTTGGTTSLHVAAKNGFLEIVKSLLKYGAIYNIKNKEGKTPFDLSKDQNVIDLLKLVRELFEDAKDGNLEIISKLKAVKPDEFVAVANAYNNQGNTLLQVAITNKHENIASVLLEMLKKPDKIQSCSSHECGLDQFERLKSAAQNHLHFSGLYLPMLRSMSDPYGSEKNRNPWNTVKEGSYFLGNVYRLVEVYKECMPGAINDRNMQIINATLVGLEFDRKHITSGYTDKAYGGKAKCFVSKGQGTVYYKLLHSELKKDVRLFIEMVERDIDVPVKRFLESVELKLQSIFAFEKLFKAIENNNCSEVETCIKEGAIVNSKHTDGRTPLHYAVNNGNIDIIYTLLTSGADATQVTNKDNTPLYIAASKGYKEIVEVLLKYVTRDKLNDFINAQTTTGGTTSLHVAAKNGFLEIVKSLLKYGAIYNIKNKEGKTPFDLSKDQNVIDLLKLVRELFEDAKDGNLEIISKLKAVNPDEFVAVANAYNNQGNTLLQVAITNKHENIASVLLKMLKKPDKIQSCSNHKCGLDQFERLKGYAENHIKFSNLYLPMLRSMSNPYESRKNPPFPWKTVKEGSYFLGNAYRLVQLYKECMPGAIDDRNMQIINATLVRLEFDPKHITSGYTDKAYGGKAKCFVSKGQGTVYYKLLHSELNKDVNLFIEMVERDIDVPVKRFLESVEQKLQSVSSFEKLFKAIENNNRSEVETCIKEGAIVNSKHTDGRTPLHYAVNNGNIGIIYTLLTSGADPTQVTNKDNTPLHIAASKGYKEIVEVLLEQSRHKLYDFINAQTTTGGTTSLHIAAKNGFLEIVKSLLKYGAIYNIKNKEGKTPFDLSKDQNVIDLLELVRELFEDAKDGNLEIISKLKAVKPDEFVAVANAYNNQGNTLIQVVITNKHLNIASVLLQMLKKPDKIQSCSRHECGFDQFFERLKSAAENHIKFSDLYLSTLRTMSYGSEINRKPWVTLKEGSYFLGNAYKLVQLYKECMPGAIDDRNMQLINATLVRLEFDPKHIISGYIDEAYGGEAVCFVSKGQGTEYYKLLHSELNKDVRLFITTVKREIDVPVKRFLESVEQKLQSVSFKRLFKAIENNNCSEVETCIKEGAIVNSKHDEVTTPLHYAVNNGNIGIICTLLTSGADPTQITFRGNTTLHIATSKGHKEIVEVLLQYISHDKLNNFINAQTIIDGTTSLHVAAKNGFLEIVKSLLKYGAIYNIKNKEGKTPFDLSKDQNVIDLLKLVRELFEDAKDGNLEIISKLKAVKPDEFVAVANAYNNQGNTLLQVAKTNKHKNIASVLLEITNKHKNASELLEIL